MSVSQTLQALGRGDHVAATDLTEFSDLAGPPLEALREGWPVLQPHQKLQTLERLLDISEDNLELDFDQVYQLAVRDTDPAVRMTAAGGLAESEDERVVAILVELLREDPDPQVRAVAASNLATFAILDAFEELPPRYAEPLRAALRGAITAPEEDREVRARALESAGAIGHEPWAAQQIGAYYGGDDLRMSLAALRAMGQSCDERWLANVIDELESEDPERRQAATIAAGNIGSEDATEAVGDLLADEDDEVRAGAIWALGEIGGAAAIDLLEEAMVSSEDEAEREAIEEALIAARFGNEPLRFLEDMTDRFN